MKDKIASDKGRSGSTDQGGGGGSNKPVLVGGAAHSEAASHAVTGGFASSLYDAGLGADIVWGVEPAVSPPVRPLKDTATRICFQRLFCPWPFCS
jgi:hypothetical protein